MAGNYEMLRPEIIKTYSNQHTEIKAYARQYYADYNMHEMGVIYSWHSKCLELLNGCIRKIFTFSEIVRNCPSMSTTHKNVSVVGLRVQIVAREGNCRNFH
jgi:hypothetical protein